MNVRKPYQSDLSDEQWQILAPMIILPEGGRPRTVDLREALNAIFYQLKTGCPWKYLPHDFPAEGTVRDYFHRFKRDGTMEKINTVLRQRVRVHEGRNPEPSLGIIDSQTSPATRTSGERGYDGGKKIKGVKRHILVDVLGLLLCVVVHAANIPEREDAKLALKKAMTEDYPRLEKILTDGGYSGENMRDWVKQNCNLDFESVKRTELHKFKVAPKRWVVERTFGWMMNFRTLSRHYE
jgi:putative transposase